MRLMILLVTLALAGCGITPERMYTYNRHIDNPEVRAAYMAGWEHGMNGPPKGYHVCRLPACATAVRIVE